MVGTGGRDREPLPAGGPGAAARIAAPLGAAIAGAISRGADSVDLFGISIIQTMLAFAPGALESLIIVAFAVDIDPAYVAAHHIARFLVLIAAVPLMARWLARRA
jgi:uncharacterized membrane protein AbrB (regulator of aidB expression)